LKCYNSSDMNKLNINGISIYNRNEAEAKEIYSSIFSRGDYSVSINTDSPLIIDCGAHIGLATIYFKKKFPSSKITAIEANPETLSFLRKNIKANKIKDVEVIWGALTKKTGILPLYVDPDNANPWSWDDSIIKDIWSDMPSRKTKKIVQVPAVHLSEIIASKVDLIKLDIEGAECEVIEEVESKLDLVNSIIIEVHPTKKTPLTYLRKIRKILKAHNFKTKEYPLDWAVFINAKKE